MDSRVRLGVSPTVATAVVHCQLWVSVSPWASSALVVCCLATAGPALPVLCLSTVFISLPAWSTTLLVWLFWLIFSLIPWLLEFHAVCFSGTFGCLLILDWLFSSFSLWEEVKGFYLCFLLGQDSSFFWILFLHVVLMCCFFVSLYSKSVIWFSASFTVLLFPCKLFFFFLWLGLCLLTWKDAIWTLLTWKNKVKMICIRILICFKTNLEDWIQEY